MSRIRLTIAAKVYALTGAFLLLAAVVAIVLLNQASNERTGTQAAFNERGIARVAQVAFKTQVQEWKNLLIRGHKKENFEKYTASFANSEKEVNQLADSLFRIVRDTVAKAQMGRFITAHKDMGEKYAH